MIEPALRRAVVRIIHHRRPRGPAVDGLVKSLQLPGRIGDARIENLRIRRSHRQLHAPDALRWESSAREIPGQATIGRLKSALRLYRGIGDVSIRWMKDYAIHVPGGSESRPSSCAIRGSPNSAVCGLCAGSGKQYLSIGTEP